MSNLIVWKWKKIEPKKTPYQLIVKCFEGRGIYIYIYIVIVKQTIFHVAVNFIKCVMHADFNDPRFPIFKKNS